MHDASDDTMIIAFGLELFWTYAIAFATCECGHRVEDAFDAINNEIVQLNWLRFSINIKRILPIFIIDVQQPVQLDVFGSFSCGRVEFKKVSIKIPMMNTCDEDLDSLFSSVF